MHSIAMEGTPCPRCGQVKGEQAGAGDEHMFSWCPNCRMHSIAMEGTPCPRCGQVK